MNHKRKRAKNARAGCLLCKPHKANGAAKKACNQTMQEKRALVSEAEQRRGHWLQDFEGNVWVEIP